MGRGAIMIAVATFAFGFALNAQQSIVSNYFEKVLKLSGPQFGYITAIREIPGFLLIFLAAALYRVSLPKLSAAALALLAGGYVAFGFSVDFWTVAPWVVISSMGYHTYLQTNYALGMSLTTEGRAGRILGRLTAIGSAGALLAMLLVFVVAGRAPSGRGLDGFLPPRATWQRSRAARANGSGDNRPCLPATSVVSRRGGSGLCAD